MGTIPSQQHNLKNPHLNLLYLSQFFFKFPSIERFLSLRSSSSGNISFSIHIRVVWIRSLTLVEVVSELMPTKIGFISEFVVYRSLSKIERGIGFAALLEFKFEIGFCDFEGT